MPDQATPDLSASHLPASVLAEVLAHLDLVVLDCPGDNSFRIVGPVPDWVTQLYPAVLTDRHGSRPQDQFPFLENFLIDAENFWRTKQPGPLKSGAWTEQAANGTSYQLEASALRIGAHKLLLIERLGRGFAEKQSALQKARETRLDYQQLTKEIQKKEILLHCIVHDLAGPLTAIKGSLDVLALKDFTQEEREFLEIGQQQVAKQECLIQDILDVFAAELGALEAVSSDPNTALDVSHCIQDVVHALAPAFSLSQIDLSLASHTDWTAAWHVVADRSQLERVIANLLDNALRYSPPHSQVTVSMVPDGNQICITVEDQGPGVTADMQASLFEKFAHRKDMFGKAGLGLYFCRMMVERWGGTIGYTSRIEGGACFWFCLPKSRQAEPKTGHAAHSTADDPAVS